MSVRTRCTNMNDFARSNAIGGLAQLIEDRFESAQHIAGHANDYKAEAVLGEIVLALQAPINGDENIKALFGS
jgi:hypothetical protein